MGLRDAWDALLGRRALTPGSSLTGLWNTKQASPRSRQQLLQAIGEVPALMAVQSRVSNDVSRLQWSFYMVPRESMMGVDGVRSALSVGSRDGASQARTLRAMLTETGDLTPYSGALTRLWRKPCSRLTAASFRWVVNTQADLAGEAIIWVKRRDSQGRPADLWPVPPHMIERQSSGDVRISIPGMPPAMVENPTEDLLCYRRPHPANPFGLGLGVAESLNNELSTDEAAAKLTFSRYENNGVPNWIIGQEGATEPTLVRIQNEWKNRFRGPQKRGQAYFSGGKITAHKLDDTIQDLGVDEQRKFFRDIIWSTYGVPPEALGLTTNSNRAQAREARHTMAEGCTAPRAWAFCDFVQERLIPQFDDPERVIAVVENPIPDDWDFRLEAFKAASHTVSRDQWKSLQGLPPGEGPDVYYVPNGLTAVPVSGTAVPLEATEDDEPDDDREPSEEPEDGDAERALRLIPGMREIDTRVNAIVSAMEPERLSKPTRGLWSRQLRWWIAREAKRLGVEVSFDILNPLMLRHIEQFSGERITGINSTTRQQLRETLLEGVRAGEGVDMLTQRVQHTFDVAKSRATIIARTEVVRSSNWGITQAQKLSGVVSMREWVATPDARTRDAHLALDGQQRLINDKFTVPSGKWTGREAEHPGAFGVAELDLQCRCMTVAVIDPAKETGEGRALSADEKKQAWNDYVAAIAPWETQAERLFAQAFAAQEKIAVRMVRERFASDMVA